MEELSKYCWGYLSDWSGPDDGLDNNQIVSIRSEEDARYIAELFPEAIYFFADEVPHPNS